jgi:tape measure domain-containing protein
MATISDNNVILRLLLESAEYKKGLRAAKKETSSFDKSVSKLKTVLTGVIAVQLIRNMGALAIKTEQTKVSFETFLGSAQKAKKVLAELNEFSLKTPFTPEEVNDAGKALLAFGINADKLIPTLGAIGDLSAGTGKNFNELAVIFGKAKVQGTLFAEDINQLTEAGIPIIDEFAKQLKVGADEVKKLGSEGKISFSNLEQAFKDMTGEGGKFFELTKKQSQTLGGLISTLQGTFTALSNTVTELFLPSIKSAVNFVTDLVAKFKEFVKVDIVTTINKEQSALNLLIIKITDTNIEQEKRNDLIQKLQRDYPAFLTNLDAEKVTNEELAKRLGKVNDQYILKIALAIEDEKIKTAANKIGRDSNKNAQRTIKLETKLIEIEKRRGLNLDLTNKTLKERFDIVTNELEVRNKAARIEKGGIVTDGDLGLLKAYSTVISNVSTKIDGQNSNLIELQKTREKVAATIKAQLGIGEVDFIDVVETEAERVTRLANEASKARKAAADKAFREGKKGRDKANEQRLKDERKALQNIEDLRALLIVNKNASSIEQSRLAAKRAIETLVGTPKQIEEQTKLIQSVLERNIKDIFNLDTAERAKSFIETLQEGIDKQKPIKLDIKPVFKAAPEDEQKFGEKLGELFDPDSEGNKKLREGLGALQEITSSIFSADDKATAAKIANIENQIKTSEDAIKRATEGGKEGADEVIAIEEAKLARLEKARQQSLEQQQRQAKIESALAATTSLVQAVPLVLKLFKKGGLVGGLAGIAAVIASIATLRSAVQKTPTFHTGTSFADETGTKTGAKLGRNEFMAKLERGEMIIPKGDSARLRGLGIKHTDILELAESTREGRLIALDGGNKDSRLIVETNNRIIEQNDKMLRYMRNLKTEVNIDERGLSIRQMSLQQRLKKRR